MRCLISFKLVYHTKFHQTLVQTKNLHTPANFSYAPRRKLVGMHFAFQLKLLALTTRLKNINKNYSPGRAAEAATAPASQEAMAACTGRVPW